MFSKQTINPYWAFHHGGRTELQFNIGFDRSDGDELRHGVAFWFETSQTLPDIAPLRAKAALFNEYLRLNPEEFSHLRMWYWDENGERSEDMLPAPVSTDIVREGVFFFMGSIRQIKAVDVMEILADFDALLPLYTYVEGRGYSGPTKKKAVKRFTFQPGCTFKKLKTKSKPSSDPVNISLRHNAMQHKLFDALAAKHGKKNVGTSLNGTESKISVSLIVDTSISAIFFPQLERDKAVIESDIGAPLDWKSGDALKQWRVSLCQDGVDVADRNDWLNQHDWMIDQLLKFDTVFRERIQKLSLSEPTSEDED